MSGYGSVALTTDTEGSRFEPGLVGAPPVPGVKIEGSLTLRLRGLPYKATQLEIEEWLRGGGVNITPGTVVIQYGTDGRPSGQAFVEVLSQDDVDAGLAMSNQHMGTRYIEVYSIAGSASEAAQSQATLPRPNRSYAVPYNEDCVIRLRGLPYSATEQDIANFLVGTSICQQGIHLVFNHQNRPSGEAYVELQVCFLLLFISSKIFICNLLNSAHAAGLKNKAIKQLEEEKKKEVKTVSCVAKYYFALVFKPLETRSPS
eukprot:TRINITY_DN10712_c0_g1_i2.p1 TRINITY_DN10712_c0_g1~~TRINITY_DN10712_c0_g1_i2.p1  ORF type:complete len:259 (+),score=38.83 TRINITY_DN10712_c0_g1_i2:48-824(+)